MRKATFIFSLALLIASCSGGDKMPKGILPKQKMGDVLWDLVEATEYVNGYTQLKDSSVDKTAEALKWYDHVYRLHHTTKMEFETSYAWYRDHPLLMKEVLDSLAHKKSPVKAAALADSTRQKDSLLPKDSLHKKRIIPPGKNGIFPIVTDTSRRRRHLPER